MGQPEIDNILVSQFHYSTACIMKAYISNYLKKEFTGSLMTSAMFNAYLILTLKFQFEKIYKFNYITSAMFNAYKISTLKLEKIKYFDNFKNSEKKKIFKTSKILKKKKKKKKKS